MKVNKKDLEKSQVELTIELSYEEFQPYIIKGAEKISHEVKIEGFRPGKAPYEILKQKIGEMTILEEAANIAINKTIDKAIGENLIEKPIGQPQVSITKLAPQNPLEYKIILSLLPAINLGDYKNMKVKMEKTETKDEEVEKMISELREMQAREAQVDREAKDGDKVILDIEIFLDKVPIEGGQGKGTGIIIGKNYIIPGFDKKIIGAKKANVREFSLPYPEEHHMAILAGKMVEFKITVKEIYERILPEVNEEFAKKFGLKSADELRENIKKSIIHEKEHKEEIKAETEMLDKIIAKTKFGEIPEILIKDEAKNMLAELEENVTRQSGKFEDYLSHLKKTRDELILDMLPDAVKRVKTSLLIREIALVEKIRVEEAEIEKEIEHIITHHKGNKEIEDRIRSYAYKEYLRNLMSGKKVIDKLKEWNFEK